MLRLTLRDGEAFEGETALDLVRAMKGASMFSDAKDVFHYIAIAQDRLREVDGIALAVAGEKLDDRCESFIRELDRLGLAKLHRLSGADLDQVEYMVRETARLLNADDLPGAWEFLRPKLRLTPDELAELDRRLGLDAKEE
ncbi:MAG TPA: hypothetical protein PLE19_24030 [Planctomycetota bacterium]|nr:hypothetical protein [Planctomycetota bacterium]HRR83337.1 hypothetical protein [Planctomycetota bacterium]HRT97868.1 hypothetical protein [Planctomycetota bacterium]